MRHLVGEDSTRVPQTDFNRSHDMNIHTEANKQEMTSLKQKEQWKAPELIKLTRNEPEKTVAKDCCSANMSLLDSGCNRPMRG
jgi:hypothetical protein